MVGELELIHLSGSLQIEHFYDTVRKRKHIADELEENPWTGHGNEGSVRGNTYGNTDKSLPLVCILLNRDL